MKANCKQLHFLNGFILLAASLFNPTFLQAKTNVNAEIMKQVAEKGAKNIPGLLQEVVEKPKVSATHLGLRLNELTRQKVKDWKTHVLESGEYDHLSDEQKKNALRNPKTFLKVPYLLEIQEVIAIKKEGKVVGYIFDVADHVQADIYQDGAWYNFYTDDKLNVVEEEENSA